MRKSGQKTIDASEIGYYAFCPRAWALKKRGYKSTNRAALDAGSEFHRKFGRRERLIRDLKVLTAILLFIMLLLILRSVIR